MIAHGKVERSGRVSASGLSLSVTLIEQSLMSAKSLMLPMVIEPTVRRDASAAPGKTSMVTLNMC
ncbi:hypothetical protein [Bradyrhizobium sp. USDA 4503]